MPNPQKWVEDYGDYLFSIAILKTNNKETAEDIVQETFLSAIKTLPGFKGESSEKTWLTAILNNKIIDFYRKKDVLKDAGGYLIETEQNFNNNFFEPEDGSYGHWAESAAPQVWKKSADEAIDRADFYRVLEYCIGKMPSKLAPVFLSRFMDEKDSGEIRKDFNLSPSNYWVIIHRSKLLMRSCLEKNWFGK